AGGEEAHAGGGEGGHLAHGNADGQVGRAPHDPDDGEGEPRQQAAMTRGHGYSRPPPGASAGSSATSAAGSGPSEPFSRMVSRTNAVRELCMARVDCSSRSRTLTSSMRRQITSATKQSSPLTR